MITIVLTQSHTLHPAHRLAAFNSSIPTALSNPSDPAKLTACQRHTSSIGSIRTLKPAVFTIVTF
jgi:hypothetical protein